MKDSLNTLFSFLLFGLRIKEDLKTIQNFSSLVIGVQVLSFLKFHQLLDCGRISLFRLRIKHMEKHKPNDKGVTVNATVQTLMSKQYCLWRKVNSCSSEVIVNHIYVMIFVDLAKTKIN
jgi:hypothetical protein